MATPHASFLAMAYEPRQAYANLAKLQHDYDGYGDGGFFDAIASESGTVARRYLSLDQAMIMGAVGNVLGRDVVRRAFATRTVERRLRPVLAMERFGAGYRTEPWSLSPSPPRTAPPTATSTTTDSWTRSRIRG